MKPVVVCLLAGLSCTVKEAPRRADSLPVGESTSAARTDSVAAFPSIANPTVSLTAAESGQQVRPAPPVSGARDQFDRYLARSVEGAPKDPAVYNTLVMDSDDCVEYGDAFSSYWVARYHIVSVGPRPAVRDTVDAVVEIVSAASQVPSGHTASGSIVTQGVRIDTLRYILVPDKARERWVVCGEERDNGYILGSYGRPDNVTYSVPHTSARTVRALVDSLQAARTREVSEPQPNDH